MKWLPKIKIWVAINGIKHVYLSNSNNLLHHNTMSDLAVSYLQIRDTSSIQYEYLITGKAMIIAKTELVDLQTMPEEMDVRSVADIYDGSSGTDSYRMVVDKLTSTRIEAYLQLLNNCFYFNGEHSTDRAVDFITGLQVT